MPELCLPVCLQKPKSVRRRSVYGLGVTLEGRPTTSYDSDGSADNTAGSFDDIPGPLEPVSKRKSPLGRVKSELASPVEVEPREPPSSGSGAVPFQSSRSVRGTVLVGGGGGGSGRPATTGVLSTETLPVPSMTRSLSRSGELRGRGGGRSDPFGGDVAVRTGGFQKALGAVA